MEALSLLKTRRSVSAKELKEPGPGPEALAEMLTIAARVPDHHKLAPWRFIVFRGAARERFGEVLAAAVVVEAKEPPSAIRIETERQRFLRAPVVVAVISAPRVDAKATPEWEQVLSSGAACFNLCLAANALGFATNWITEWYAYSPAVRGALRLAAHERVAGFVYIGSGSASGSDRDRPRLADIVTEWTA